MFKEHPKGLLAAALANMGERFGFYTMMAILVLYLQAKFVLPFTATMGGGCSMKNNFTGVMAIFHKIIPLF